MEHEYPLELKSPKAKPIPIQMPFGAGILHRCVYEPAAPVQKSLSAGAHLGRISERGLGPTVEKLPDLRGLIQPTSLLKFPVRNGPTGCRLGSTPHSHSWAQPMGDPNIWNAESPRSRWQGKHGTLASNISTVNNTQHFCLHFIGQN